MEILEVIDKYGLVVVIIGLLSSAVCGAIKVPVAKKIRSKALSERAASDRIRAVCTLIVAVSSVIGVVLSVALLFGRFHRLKLNSCIWKY